MDSSVNYREEMQEMLLSLPANAVPQKSVILPCSRYLHLISSHLLCKMWPVWLLHHTISSLLMCNCMCIKISENNKFKRCIFFAVPVLFYEFSVILKSTILVSSLYQALMWQCTTNSIWVQEWHRLRSLTSSKHEVWLCFTIFNMS